MDYEKKYKEAVEKIRNLLDEGDKKGYTIVTYKKDFESIFPELKESEDEKVRKHLIALVTWSTSYSASGISNVDANKMLDWLEKQGEHANFRDKIQVGDKVTRNEAGVLVNLSQLKRVAKPSKRQGEQEKDILEDYILDGNILDGNEDGLIAETIRYKKEKQGEPIDKIVKRAMNEKQRVLLTETNGDANIDWDTRSLQDVKLLLEYGLDYIKKLEKQGEHKASYTTIVETGNGGINALVTRELPIEMKSAEESLGVDSDTYNKIVDECIFGEQKPTDKVEPKFKVGDFIANDYCFGKVIALTDDAYLLDTEQGIPFSCEHNTHLWTITDARNGDVLVNWNNTAFIFNGIEDETVKFHVAYNEKWDTIKTPSTKLSHLGFPEPQFEFHPATKEQRDLLFQKMKEAGYTFDFERKKLEKIKPKPEENKGNIGGISPNWSEDDERMFNSCCAAVAVADYYTLDDKQDIENWLQSLKDRVQPQPKQEWSEEDKYMYDILCGTIENTDINENTKYKLISWLKSLRPLNRWKPSELQLGCLSDAIEHYNSLGYPASKLKELLDDLKKLKEE